MIVLIDNYDSFTFNLFHDLALLGADVEVVRNDAESVEALIARQPAGFVISPGPCDPPRAGVSAPLAAAAAQAGIPLFGVCLGHQSIAHAQGAAVVRGAAPVHGKTARIRHHGRGVFAGLPNPFTATRYHSLVVDRATLPERLTVTAETEDGIVMGLMDDGAKQYGVQFHPESVATPEGRLLIGNFLSLCGLDWNRDAAAAPERAAA